jgi:hypothetical protein
MWRARKSWQGTCQKKYRVHLQPLPDEMREDHADGKRANLKRACADPSFSAFIGSLMPEAGSAAALA